MSFPPEPFIYAPFHGMNTILRMFALSNFSVPKNVCKVIEIWFIPLTRSFKLWRMQVFSIKSRACNTPELKIRRKIARTLEWVWATLTSGEIKRMVQRTPWDLFQDCNWDLLITMIIVIISGRCFLPLVVISIVITPEEV